MIKMKALRSFGYPGVNEGKVQRGREFKARDDNRAKDLEVHGLAYRLQEKVAPRPEPVLITPDINKVAESGPLDLAGGRIGADAPVPSSAPVQQRRRRRSNTSEDGLLS